MVINVTIQAGAGFRVHVNEPKTKGKIHGKPIEIPRKAFPNRLFSQDSF
jgi:hypothetical protein